MTAERRSLSFDTFLVRRKENRLNHSTTEEPVSRMAIPEKLSQLRQKLGQKAKQEPQFKHLNRRSQRRFKKPKDESYYAYFKRLGVELLNGRATA
ncbi:MAG: hypothetical protein ACREEM_26830 [Blastocatellia bacterium]